MAVRLTGRQSRHGAGSENLFTLADRQTSNNAALSINSRPPHSHTQGRSEDLVGNDSMCRKLSVMGTSCRKVVKLNYFFN